MKRTSYDDLPSVSRWVGRLFPWVGGIVVVAFVLAQSVCLIPEGSVGIVSNVSGTPEDSLMTPGLHWHVPFVSRVQRLDLRARPASTKISAHFKDLQPVTCELHWQCTVPEKKSADLIQSYGGMDTVSAQTVMPLMREATEQVIAQFTPEDFLTARNTLSAAIRKRFEELLSESQVGDLAPPPVQIGGIAMTDIAFSPAFQQALGKKLLAENTADCIAIEAAAFQKNPDALRLRSLERWDGRLPMVVVDPAFLSNLLEQKPSLSNSQQGLR